MVFSCDLYNITLNIWVQFLSNAAYSVTNYGTKNMMGGGGGVLLLLFSPPHFSIRSAGPAYLWSLSLNFFELIDSETFPRVVFAQPSCAGSAR